MCRVDVQNMISSIPVGSRAYCYFVFPTPFQYEVFINESKVGFIDKLADMLCKFRSAICGNLKIASFYLLRR